MNKKDERYILRFSKKLNAIEYLGGKCCRCGDENIFHLIFHHENEKNFPIAEGLSKRWGEILKEIKKCKLFCANCHQELHGSNSKIKNKLLEIKGSNKCSVCGYTPKNNASLSFHHEKEKDFWITSKCNYTRNELGLPVNIIVEEMKKCKVVCENCHMDIHSNLERYTLLKEKIQNKRKIYKEKCQNKKPIDTEKDKRKKCDYSLCLSLRESGKTVKEIEEVTGYSPSTVKRVLSNNGFKGRIEKQKAFKDEIVNMWKNGKTAYDIAKIKNIHWATVFRVLKKSPEITQIREDDEKNKKDIIGAIINEYNNGMSVIDLAGKFSISDVQIYRILKENKTRTPHKKISHVALVKDYRNGKTVKDLSEKVGCSENRILSLLKRHGVAV